MNRALTGFTSTIFAEMSALAQRTGAVNLGQGFPDFDGPPSMLERARRAIAEGANQYPPGPGIPDLRAAIAEHQRRFYGIELDADTQVLVTAGATEGVAAAMLGLLEPGDEVVLLEPYYDSYAATIALAGECGVRFGSNRRTSPCPGRRWPRRSGREPDCCCSIRRTTRPAWCSAPTTWPSSPTWRVGTT